MVSISVPPLNDEVLVEPSELLLLSPESELSSEAMEFEEDEEEDEEFELLELLVLLVIVPVLIAVSERPRRLNCR